MATGVQASFNHGAAKFDERPHHVRDDLRAAEQLGERVSVVFDLDDLVIRGLDAGDLIDDLLHALLVASGGDEGDAVFAQIFADEAAGVAGDTVDDDGLLVGHGVSSQGFLVD